MILKDYNYKTSKRVVTILDHFMNSLGQLYQCSGTNSSFGVTVAPGVSLSSQYDVAICGFTQNHSIL